MKLRNKKTGEILGSLGSFIIQNPNRINCESITKYDSLAELNEEWEDVPEEPKKYYYITSCGETTHRGYRLWENESIYDKNRKQIGNYFETEEEAEKAVEKLKAWKRLKDKGFVFDGYHIPAGEIHFNMEIPKDSLDGIAKDLDLLFGGKE